jgi:hypothetical protein
MFNLSPQARAYIISLVRLRLKLSVEQASDKKMNEVIDEVIAFVKRQFGF